MSEANGFCPNFFLLGAAKCGTTSLANCLMQTKGVCRSNPKEPYFFEKEYESGLDFYERRYFSHWQGEPVIGEARHRNLYFPYIPERIHQVNPDAKLLVIVRNPIDRAYSHWLMHWSIGKEDLRFRPAIEADLERIGRRGYCESAEEERESRTYVDTGFYWEQIKRYLDLFPEKQLKVILFEDFVKEPKKSMQSVADFLGLDENAASDVNYDKRQANVPPWARFAVRTYRFVGAKHLVPEPVKHVGRNLLSRLRRGKTMDDETRSWLAAQFVEKNAELSNFLGRDLSHWK